MFFSFNLHTMTTREMYTLPPLSQFLANNCVDVNHKTGQWHIHFPGMQQYMTLSMSQIGEIVNSMPDDARAVFLEKRDIKQLIAYMYKSGAISPQMLQVRPNSSQSTQGPRHFEYEDKMRHMRELAGHHHSERAPQQAVPFLVNPQDVHQLVLDGQYSTILKETDPNYIEYCKLQIAGEKGVLQEKLAKLEEQSKHAGWFKNVEYEKQQIATLKKILEKDITDFFHKIKHDSSLEVAKHLVKNMQNRYEHGLLSKGIFEAAQKLLHARQDYQQELRRIAYEKKKAILQELKIDAQSCILNSLEQSNDHKAVAAGIWQTVDRVYTTAYKHNYDIHPEVDFQIINSLSELEVSTNPQEFTYHIATIDHLLHDIQNQTANALDQHPTILERSPELLARGVQKYFEYLAPTESELSFICDLACYVSDVTIGTEYLAPEVYEQRIQQFWNTIDNISFENLSQLSAEHVLDATMYVAARASWAWGATRALPLLKHLKTVSSSTARVSAVFADKFIKVFDNVIGNSPAIINADGTVIWNASQEVVAESHRIIQAFDGLKDKVTGKTPPEVVDNSDKVLSEEKKLKSKKVSVLINKATPKAKQSTGPANQYELKGDYQDALKDFKSLQPQNVVDVSQLKDGSKLLGQLEDGTIVMVRKISSRGKDYSGGPTLEIRISKNNLTKLRYL